MHVVAHDLLRAFLEALRTTRVASRRDDRFALTWRGSAVPDDRMVRATYTTVSDFPTGLYRDLGPSSPAGRAATT